MKKKHLFIALVFYIVAILYLAISTPITPHEAKIFFTSEGVVHWLMHAGTIYVDGFLGLRILFIPFGLISVYLFYKISQRYFSKKNDAYVATIIYMFLPGILTATSMASIAILVLPLVLFFVLMYEQKKYIALPFVMFSLFFIHDASIIFFIALLIYGFVHKDKLLTISSSAFLLAFLIFTKGIEIGGRPSGHFIEIFGLYASVFSPLLFLYFFYAMYRILLREKKTLLWYVSFTALAFSLLLSIRQRVHLTDFAPYVMISIIPMLDIFNKSVRVRLPEFQKRYKQGFVAVMVLLLISIVLVIFHQISYKTMTNKKQHFAKNIYSPYYFSKKLNNDDKECYQGFRKREYYQLQYYGFLPCDNY
ncbi:MAG: Arginine/ornithine antiporter ArcD [uncultured Sulfurovum sp.]|uniref:Arginine/ornithine antiporter ArcD n=1 Tax=uncultured Sulfurovum sp. TaxID=269237 RepID=A0A6S6SHI7_9BACT|nr:MAG: Arginine/ornithine antiporter ArcD [uncultured Sulfurovum sp.]